MKICVAVARYSLTGVPLNQIRLARALAAQGHEVDLMFGHVDAQYSLPETPGITVIVLGRAKARGMLMPLQRYFRRRKPDVVFAAEDNLTGFVLLAALLSRTRARISGSSRVPPSFTYSNKPFTKRWAFKQMMRAVMWRADALTCVSQDMVADYRAFFPAGPHVAVYNVIVDAASHAKALEPVDHPWFVDKSVPIVIGAGTLSPRKGFDVLIRAVKQLRDRGRMVRLVIFGEGRARPELEALCAELGMADVVSLPGRISNPIRYFARADVFALSSYAEGLPTVLVEAMMAGCSPVATDCPTGPREVLERDRYGKLIPMGDPAALANGIAALLDQPIARDRLAEGVRPFEEDVVIARHFEVLGIDRQIEADGAG